MIWKLSEKDILKKIEKFRAIDGWLSDQEALGLYTTASKLSKNATAVEIGSWQGKSTYCIAKGLRTGKVWAIDPFNADGGLDLQSQDEYNNKKGNRDLLEVFTDNMRSLDVLDKIVVKKGYSNQFADEVNKIDFLFIDGDHSIEGCKSDFELYAHKIVPGGFIAFHDYYAHRPELGPTHVIDNIVLKSTEFAFHHLYDSLWVGRKKA